MGANWRVEHAGISCLWGNYNNIIYYYFVSIELSGPDSRLVFVSLLSVEGRAERSAEVPRVPAVVLSRAAARLCAAHGASGARCGLGLAPSPARPAPARKTRTRSRGTQQDQERKKEQDRVHRAPAHGSGEEI